MPPSDLGRSRILVRQGVTDGLPLVPPARERVASMLATTARDRDALVGEMPPNKGRVSVEKAAVNAVMAACRPEYLPVLLAAIDCACDPNCNLHGMSASTHFAAPLMVVNGPIRTRIGMNAGFGVFGPGYRTNATLGRALRLLMIDVGGAKPGATSMSTFDHPGRDTYCIAENEEASPWPPYHASRRFPEGSSAGALFAGEAPHGISDYASRTVRALAGSLGWSTADLWNSTRFPLYSHTMLSSVPNTHVRSLTTAGLRPTSARDGAASLSRAVAGRDPQRGHESPVRENAAGDRRDGSKASPRRTKFMSSWLAAPPDASRWRFPAGWESGTARARLLGL